MHESATDQRAGRRDTPGTGRLLLLACAVTATAVAVLHTSSATARGGKPGTVAIPTPTAPALPPVAPTRKVVVKASKRSEPAARTTGARR